MNIGIIKAKDKQYYISKTNNTYKVECITDEKAYTLTKEETIDLIKNVFSSDMKKISEENNLTIYEDAANNKRFFEDGKENYLYFYYYNGEDALLYQGQLSEKINELVKEFKMNSKAYGFFIMYGTIEMLMFVSLLFGNADIPEFPKEEYYFLSTSQMTAEELIDDYTFALKDKLPDEKIAYLCNKDLFEDVLKVANPSRKHMLSKYMQDLDYTYFSAKEKESKTDINGYYDNVRNKISLRDNSDEIFYMASAHEVAHSLQDHNKYTFIREACAEITAYEYNGQEKSSYKEPRNYVDALMELIGPQPVFECNYKGDTTSFEEAIKAHLSQEDAEELLELFTHSPHYNDNFEEEAKRIESLILKMYENINHKDGSKDLAFNAILSGKAENRYYFNTHSDLYYQDITVSVPADVHHTIQKENVNCYVREITYELTEEEFDVLKAKPENRVYTTYIANEGYFFEGDEVSDGINTYSIYDAIEKGFIKVGHRFLSKKDFYYTLDEYEAIRNTDPSKNDNSVDSYKDTIVRKDNYEEYEIVDVKNNTIYYKATEEVYETLPPMSEKFPDQMKFAKEDSEKVY